MTTRIPCLDGLRGIAAIAVMEFYFAIFFLPQAKLFDILPGLDGAYLAVDLFFMISGFVMAHVFHDYDAVVIATDHDAVDYQALCRHAKLVIDTRNACARHGCVGEHIVKA